MKQSLKLVAIVFLFTAHFAHSEPEALVFKGQDLMDSSGDIMEVEQIFADGRLQVTSKNLGLKLSSSTKIIDLTKEKVVFGLQEFTNQYGVVKKGGIVLDGKGLVVKVSFLFPDGRAILTHRNFSHRGPSIPTSWIVNLLEERIAPQVESCPQAVADAS